MEKLHCAERSENNTPSTSNQTEAGPRAPHASPPATCTKRNSTMSECLDGPQKCPTASIVESSVA
eukprot:524189-Rhodomonas_salina.3